jgi:hypothetical protein
MIIYILRDKETDEYEKNSNVNYGSGIGYFRGIRLRKGLHG